MANKRRGSATFNQPSQIRSSEPMNLAINIIGASAKGKYFAVNGASANVYAVAGTVSDLGGTLMATPGTFNNLTALIDTATATPGETFTLFKNGSATALTVTIPDSATTASDLIDQVSVVAGDYVSINMDNGSDGGFTNGAIALQFVPS